MPVKEVLRMFSAPELSEWAVYEQAYGPLDNSWQNEALAQIQEQMQNMVYMLGAKSFEQNPFPKPSAYPRPGFMVDPAEFQDAQPVEDEPELIPDEFFAEKEG